MFRNISFFGFGKKSAFSTPSIYSDYKLLTEIDVPATGVVWHRIHGEAPEVVGKEGFGGREDFPTDNLKSYIAFNTAFGGFGGTVSADKAIEFAKKGANNSKNYLYSSVNPNVKISIPAFIRETTDELSESATASKINEMEVMVLKDVAPEFIFYATDDLEKFARGEEVENLMHRINPELPRTYKSSDVVTPSSILLHLAKTGCTTIIAEGIKKQVFNMKEMLQLAKQPEYAALSEYLEDESLTEHFGTLQASTM
ncbi:hypothetical protein FOLKNPGA_01918 [Legionella sp. PC1000]|uniref:hypothetical protein n=1 Tax=Legionella sp. PC1000 TaxID=2746060 RepID=UPI0015FD71A5|nr:hypothetical protein [Legionella sp. PC1000]QLZ69136.1 hypothetical protein FOLKNPGA_01918 [Legionella sp. PC1000]